MAIQLAMWRGVAMALTSLLLAALAPTPVHATSVRIAIPDLAGMLYPQQSQGRVARFVSPSTSVKPFFAERIAEDQGVQPCDGRARLCLDLAWASQYQYDPFVLVAFESKYAVSSSTFDDAPMANDKTSVLPIIEGDQSTASSLNATNQPPMRTLWRFHVLVTSTMTTISGSSNSTIDVLFRLRQQSQLGAVRDQLLVHVVASQLDDHTQQAAVETYAVYGNQRVYHKIVRGSARQIRLDVDIERDSSRADVLLQDSYPLGPVVSTEDQYRPRVRIADNNCRRCTAQFLKCSSIDDLDSGACTFQTSTAKMVSCLRDSRGLSTDWFHGVLAGDIGEDHDVTGALWSCLSSIYALEAVGNGLPNTKSESWYVTSTLSCLAARQCPFGLLDANVFDAIAATKMLQLRNPVPIVYQMEWPTAESLDGVFTVAVGGGQNVDPIFSVTTTTAITSGISSAVDVAGVFQSVLGGLENVQVKATEVNSTTTSRFDVEISGFPVYLEIKFVPSNVSTVSIIQTGGGGATFLHVTAFNSTQLIQGSDCDVCVSELEACRLDDTCRLKVLPCVKQELVSVNSATASINAEYGTYRIDILPVLAAHCFVNAPMASWNHIRRAFACLSRFQCRLDSTNSTSMDEQTFFRLESGTQVIKVPGNDSRVVVDLLLSTPQATFHFNSPAADLAAFVRLFVFEGAADVSVEFQKDAANASLLQLHITYANTLVPWIPSLAGSSELVAVNSSVPKGSLDFADSTTFSVDKISAAITPFLSIRAVAEDQATASNYLWQLAPECLSCSARLYGCSPDDITRRSCRYGNANSQLAQCVRQAFPRDVILSIINASTTQDAARPSRVVTPDVTRCIQVATALAGDSLESRTAVTRALSCFAETQCPFGPVDLVENNRTLQLTTSTYMQSLRISTQQFRLNFVVSMGKYTIAQVTVVDSDNATRVLSDALAPFGIAVRAQTSNLDTEWTVVIYYDNVVASDFDVQLAASSVPAPIWIDQARLRPTTRLVVSPRRVSKVYLASEVDTATPKPTHQLAFSDECRQCDSVHLAACGRSQYCRTTVAPCFSSFLDHSTFGDLKQTQSDGEISVDVAAILRTCVMDGSYFDWWEPIQLWLGCYASARCPITRLEQGRINDAYLEFLPAIVEITTTVNDLWVMSPPSAFEVTIQPAGSSMSGRFVQVTSKTELQDTLEHASQGISKVTITMTPLSNTPGDSIKARYEDPFLGLLRVETRNSNGIVSSTTSSSASLLVRSTTDIIPDSPWSGLADTLSSFVASYQGAIQPPCSMCATQYLQQCHDMPTCRGYFLECLSVSINSHFRFLRETDQSVYEVLTACSRNKPLSDWWPVQRYLSCMRDFQCPASAPNSVPTYVRLHAGKIRLYVDASAQSNQVSIGVSFDGKTLLSTLGTLRSLLQSAIGTAGVVEMQMRYVVNSNTNVFDFYFRDFVGKIPTVTYGGAPVESWPPDVVFYSYGAVDSSVVSSDLASYMVVPPCSGCYEHLKECVRGDSYDSLLCRYQTLPCVRNLIIVSVPSGATGVQSPDGNSVDFSDALQTCFGSYYPPMQSIAKYFGCLVRTGCSLNMPRSIDPTIDLKFHPGEQTLYAVGSHVVEMAPPPGVGDSVPQTLSALNVDNLAWKLRTSVLQSLADVAVEEEVFPNASQRLSINYTNYLGRLPIVSSSDVTVIKQSEPSIGISSSDPIANGRWWRIEDAFYTVSVDTSAKCSECTLTYLTNCPVCISTIVPSLLMMLAGTAYATAPLFNLTDIFYTCVDTVPPSDWIKVAQMLSCFMTNGCPMSSDSGSQRPPHSSTTFAMISPAKLTLSLPNTMPQMISFASGQAPTHMLIAPAPGPFTELSVDEDDNYADLKRVLLSMLDTVGQSPQITVTKRDLQPDSLQLVLDLEITDFFGWLPQLKAINAGPTLVSTLPHIVGQTFGNVSGASIAGLVAALQPYATPLTPAAKVLTAACATCASDFYGCDLYAIASGQCTYSTATSLFSACLRQRLPPSVFYGVARVVDATYIISAALTTCFAVVQDQDQVAGASSFHADAWNAVNVQLACFEIHVCAFGPLTESLASGHMIVLQSTRTTRSFDVASSTFTAVFRSSFGFRIIESTPFSDATTDDDLLNLVSAILPQADITVTKTELPNASGFTISVAYGNIYFPDFGLVLDAGMVVVSHTSPATAPVALRTVSQDTMYIDDAAP